jgi:hypothetical protein
MGHGPKDTMSAPKLMRALKSSICLLRWAFNPRYKAMARYRILGRFRHNSAALLWRQFAGIVAFGFDPFSIRIKRMFVVVHSKSGEIYSFGLTPRQATKAFSNGSIWYDGPSLDVRPCSPALFRRLQAEKRKRSFYSFCRINHEGIAVCRTGRSTASRHQKG